MKRKRNYKLINQLSLENIRLTNLINKGDAPQDLLDKWAERILHNDKRIEKEEQK